MALDYAVVTYVMIIPVDEVEYAAVRRPTQNAQPGVQPDKGWKSVKIYSAECLPFLATATIVTRTDTPPEMLQRREKP